MPELVLVDINEYFYRSSEGEDDEDISPEKRRGIPIYRVYDDERAYFKITSKRNGMYHLSGKYGDLGWVYPSAIIEWL